jgi:hypothetical protein
MAIAGHLSQTMVEHYSHIRMAARRAALEGITKQVQTADFTAGVHQTVHQFQNENSRTPANYLKRMVGLD